jgi:hypothetical protein
MSPALRKPARSRGVPGGADRRDGAPADGIDEGTALGLDWHTYGVVQVSRVQSTWSVEPTSRTAHCCTA